MLTSLVVGSNSFVGNQLIQQLKGKTIVTGLYHKNTNRLDPSIAHFPIEELNTLPGHYDNIFIVSAFIPEGKMEHSSRLAAYRTNVEFVATICERFPKSRIIFTSSVSVYAAGTSPITESSSLGGLSEYGISKLWGEKIVAAHPNFAIVRLSSVFGQGMNTGTIIPRFINDALSTGVIRIWGDGRRAQNYIHVEDAARFLVQAAATQGNNVYLACSEQSCTNETLARIIADFTKADIMFTGQDPSPSFFYDNRQTVDILNCRASISLRDGIKSLINE